MNLLGSAKEFPWLLAACIVAVIVIFLFLFRSFARSIRFPLGWQVRRLALTSCAACTGRSGVTLIGRAQLSLSESGTRAPLVQLVAHLSQPSSNLVEKLTHLFGWRSAWRATQMIYRAYWPPLPPPPLRAVLFWLN